MGFMSDIQNDSKQYGGGGSNSDFFKFKKGDNKIRILVQPKTLATHFFGKGVPAIVCVGIDEGCKYHGNDNDKPGLKLATYIVDREDGKVKLAELPMSITYSLNDLQEDSEYAFSDFPMPYDVKIKYDPDNADPKAKYRLIASPTKAPLTDEENKFLDEAVKKMTPEQYIEKRKAKVGTKQEEKKPEAVGGAAYQGDDYPDEINSADIPF